IADEAARRLVGEIALCVEFGLRLTDQNLGLVQRMHIEEDAASAQIVLRASAAGHAGGRTDDRAWLAGEGLIGWARGPVDRVLQHARHRVIVFGTGEEQRIGCPDLPPQRLDRRWKALLP